MQNPTDAFAPGASGVDASGAAVAIPAHATRIVSLVPSVTESLFALGLGDRVVGVTEWCIHPRDLPARVARVRGTKNPDCAAIGALAPDLVLANLEENREIDVRRLRARGLAVWVDYPRTVAEAIEHLRRLARLGATPAALDAVLAPIEDALAHPGARRTRAPLRGSIAVWRDPWMTLSRDTYAHDLLACAGIANVFADATERRIALTGRGGARPGAVPVPDEPYRFGAADADELARGPCRRRRAPSARAGCTSSTARCRSGTARASRARCACSAISSHRTDAPP